MSISPTPVALLALLVIATTSGAGELTVTSVDPGPNSISAPIDTAVVIRFDRTLDPATVDHQSVVVFGRWSGRAEGTLSLSEGDTVVTLDPARPLSSGETVTVTLSHDLAAADGSPFRAAGHAFQFWTAAAASPGPPFTRIATMTTRTVKNISSRAYGGIGSDLNNDGFPDLTIVNEDTGDLRVFMNLADTTGAFAPFIQPTFPVSQQASPSEPWDFDRNGRTDICVVNIATSSVSILLGNGDGTFGPEQEIAVGLTPRGIAVLDVDGDGDGDIVNTNAASDNLSLLLNDGNGIFGPPVFFDSGIGGEWSLAAADMGGDGIFDLVVGGMGANQIVVLHGNGDGTFTAGLPRPAGGGTWMLALGDVSGDGHVDVSSANSSSNNGAILLNDGAGGLLGPVTSPTDPFPLATDLGDIDGDGDLDWVTSSFSGDFFLFLNDGSGAFTFQREFAAPQAASCALLLDIDNDFDLDLALVDELADVVMIERNDGPLVPGDATGDGQVDVADLLAVLGAWGPCPGCSADVDFNDVVDVADLLLVLAEWGS